MTFLSAVAAAWFGFTSGSWKVALGAGVAGVMVSVALDLLHARDGRWEDDA
jgi:ABC-type enterobactin transport system permease subunit